MTNQRKSDDKSGPGSSLETEQHQRRSGEDERTASVTTYVTPGERERLDEEAFYQDLSSRSKLVRKLIYAYLDGEIELPEE